MTTEERNSVLEEAASVLVKLSQQRHNYFLKLRSDPMGKRDDSFTISRCADLVRELKHPAPAQETKQEATDAELTAHSLKTASKDWVEDVNYGGSKPDKPAIEYPITEDSGLAKYGRQGKPAGGVDVDLARIKAYCEKATAEPWIYRQGGWRNTGVPTVYGPDHAINPNTPCDGHFIANARTDLPLLVSALSRLQAENEGMRKAGEELRSALLLFGPSKQFDKPCFCDTDAGIYCVGQVGCVDCNRALEAWDQALSARNPSVNEKGGGD